MPLPFPPAVLRIPAAEEFSGLSRATLYRLAGAGRVIFKKSGRSTLVDFASLAAHVESLNRANIRAAA